MDDLGKLARHHAKRIAKAESDRARAVQDRDNDIRHALENGHGPTEIARAFNLTRGRIHQIRDHH